MTVNQQTQLTEVARNARIRLDSAQETGRWFQFVFSENADGTVTGCWNGLHFNCESHAQVLKYVEEELQRLRETCPCCKMKGAANAISVMGFDKN